LADGIGIGGQDATDAGAIDHVFRCHLFPSSMRFQLDAVLTSQALEALRDELLTPQADWLPGHESAGWHARGVKHNRQLDRASPLHQRLAAQVTASLEAQPLFQAAALPVRIHGLLFSRCGPGEGYGRHVDNAFMAGGRADVSFTLFLQDPAAYSGGGLMLESPAGEEEVRLVAGSAIVYPSTLLHRVATVTGGERLVAVGWIQSRVRDAERREILFDLDTARRQLFQQEGKTEVFDLISRSYSNLLRRWGE
jgi:PKHD-type hydroxylase